MSKYNASSHSTYNVAYHIVFSPKYRYNLVRYRAAEGLKTLLLQAASLLSSLQISILTRDSLISMTTLTDFSTRMLT